MSEKQAKTPEVVLSPEQEKLIATAHELLELPKAVQNGPYFSYRPTTRIEKVQWLLGKVTNTKREPITYNDGCFEKPSTVTSTKILNLESLGGWGDGLYLRQTRIEDLDAGVTTESLSLYINEIKNDRPAATDYGAWYEKITWSQELLQPIDNAREIARLHFELDEALSVK